MEHYSKKTYIHEDGLNSYVRILNHNHTLHGKFMWKYKNFYFKNFNFNNRKYGQSINTFPEYHSF